MRGLHDGCNAKMIAPSCLAHRYMQFKCYYESQSYNKQIHQRVGEKCKWVTIVYDILPLWKKWRASTFQPEIVFLLEDPIFNGENAVQIQFRLC